LSRLISTIRFVKKPASEEEYCIGIDSDGVHAAEGLIIARYMMFTQVYFHKTRVIYDHHLVEVLKEILANDGGTFPSPINKEGVEKYLSWDDWRVFGQLSDMNSENAVALRNRQHYRLVFESPEVANTSDILFVENAMTELKNAGINPVRRDSSKSWYKFDNPATEILVHRVDGRTDDEVVPMTEVSTSVKGLPPVRQSRIYVAQSQRKEARKVINTLQA